MIVAIWVSVLFFEHSYAQTTQKTTLSNDEVWAAFCIVANQGIYTVASERQAGTTKANTKKILDRDLKKINTSFKNKQLVKSITDIWYRALDNIYQMPIQKTEQSKKIFVSGITEDALISCMNNQQI